MIGKVRKAIGLARFLMVQRFKGYDVPREPHFDEQSTTWFKQRLAASHAYLEYGSGGSTLLADRLGKPTTSIENDRFFAASVRKLLSANTTVDIRAIDIGLTGPWGVPVQGKPNPARIARWRTYVEAPFQSGPAAFPDLVLVDGRFRRACALEVTRQAQARGVQTTIMVDDYALTGRNSYADLEPLLGTPKRVGRAAVFETGDAKPVPVEAVTLALHDFR